MNQSFHHFKIAESATKFISKKGTEYASTAKISFFDAEDHLIGNADYGIADIESIYQSIEDSGEIKADEAYIRNFSLTAYRRTRLLDKHEKVELKKIDTSNAFFHVTSVVDFSFLQMQNSTIEMNAMIVCGGDLDFNHSQLQEVKLDLSYMIQRKGGLNFSNIHMSDGNLTFKNSIFSNGDKLFQYARFDNTMVDFTNCEFNSGEINMVDSHFTGGLSFKVARFGEGRISFQFAKFANKDVHFDQVEFGNGDLDFRTTEFTDIKLSFNRSTAGKGAWDFSGMEATNGKITFKKTEFGNGRIDFTDCNLKNTDLIFGKAETHEALIVFENAKLTNIDFSHCFFNRFINLRILSAQSIDFTHAVVRDIIDLNYAKDIKQHPILYFTNMSLPGLLYCDWSLNKIKQSIYNQNETTTWNQKANQFLMIKENFKRNGQYDNEDFAYVEYRRCKALYIRARNHSNIFGKATSWLLYWLDKLMLDYTGLYGTSPIRVFITMVLSYVAFSFGYLILILAKWGDIIVSVGEKYELPLLAKSFYHSSITMLTIGYGDHFPIGLARSLSAVQGFVGMLLLSYFTVSLVHKILR